MEKFALSVMLNLPQRIRISAGDEAVTARPLHPVTVSLHHYINQCIDFWGVMQERSVKFHWQYGIFNPT